jgi:hypothetical protein
LNEVASAMLKCLCSLAENSIIIFDNTTLVDLNKLPHKDTRLFVSSQYAATIENKPEQIKAIFILEDDKSKADCRERFPTGQQLIFHLADELYRRYQIEANDFSTFGDTSIAEIKERQANKIHVELKKAYKSTFRDNNTITTSIDITTNIVWLRSKSEDDSAVKKMQNLLSEIVPPFQLFEHNTDCFNYIQKTEKCGAVFLIIDVDHENSTANDSHPFPNVQVVYRYGKASSENETMIGNADDLCFQLLSNLAVHYDKLGSICSGRQDAKTAKDMFIKVSKLYTILAEF